ncbi:FadR/GntR family transcriptional regulator [Cereibacter sp. SYSU M97828]|nr:FadR/GntR family transcriptional regulator [Cereibacter flavus]
MGLLETRLYGPKPRGSHGVVVEELGLAIVSGQIAEGAILPGDPDLMERFGVSRTVLREAMKTLAAKHLIEAKSRVGTRVLPRDRWNFIDADVIGWRLRAGIDLEFAMHLAEMRLALEPAAAALAARHATSDELVELYAIAARMEDPAHSRESIAKVDLDFHVAIARMSRNPFMRSVTSLIEAALAVMFHLSSPASSPDGLALLASNHLRIVHAIAARDAARAEDAMRNVINVGVEGLERSVKSGIPR